MNWVTSVRQVGGQQQFLVVAKDGSTDHVLAESLTTVGIPSADSLERMVYTGGISTWTRTPSSRYAQAFGYAAPHENLMGHSVFCHQLDDGTSVHVPALVFIRALFKPHRLILPVVFSPGNIDVLGFVDYSSDPPVVIVDREREKYLDHRKAEDRYEPLRWLHSSRSARACCQSVFTNSLNGRIDLALPQGQFRLVMHGHRVGSELFVTKATVISVNVGAADCITGSELTYVFHRMASPERKVAALSTYASIPTRADGMVILSGSEWSDIEPLLNSNRRRERKYSRRELLDVMLQKLSSGRSWKAMSRNSGFVETILTTTFRQWQRDGRLARVLERLEFARRNG